MASTTRVIVASPSIVVPIVSSSIENRTWFGSTFGVLRSRSMFLRPIAVNRPVNPAMIRMNVAFMIPTILS